MKKYCNYVLSFSDGSFKIGVTSRPETRLAEICRIKRHEAKLIQGAYTPFCEKSDAFKIEYFLCSLFSCQANNGTREWFIGGINEFHFLIQSTGMFWQSICNKSYRKSLTYTEMAL